MKVKPQITIIVVIALLQATESRYRLTDLVFELWSHKNEKYQYRILEEILLDNWNQQLLN